MMRGIRRLVVYTAATGLLAAAAVSASLEVAHAQTVATVCGGNSDNGYICNLDATIPSASSITVNVNSGEAADNVNVGWSVTCTDSSGSQSEAGATDDASTASSLNVALTPLPPTADGPCSVNVSITLSATTPAKIDFTGTLSYDPAGSTSSSAVHPIKGYKGLCVSDSGNSSANRSEIQIWTCGSTNQAENWTFSDNELKHNGKCMNDQADAGSGGHVVLYSCSSAANDKWSVLANGELKLKAHNGTLCLNDPRSSTKDGTQLIVYKCTDSANEKWSLP
jgi:beta-glucosidase